MMEGRRTGAREIAAKNNEIRRAHIEHYRDRAALARSRKGVRELRNNLRRSGMDKRTAKKRTSELTPDQRQKIGALASVQQRRVREAERAAKRLKKQEHRQAGIADDIRETEEVFQNKQRLVTDVAHQHATYESDLAEHETSAQDLYAQLDSMSNDDPDRADIEQRLTAIEALVAREREQIEALAQRRNRLQADLTILEGRHTRLTAGHKSVTIDSAYSQHHAYTANESLADIKHDIHAYQTEILSANKQPTPPAGDSEQPTNPQSKGI